MAEFKLPELGENIEEAEVLKVLVSEGDGVEVDQNVLELETDKATFELPSSVSGTVRKVHVGEGDRLRLGQTILTVDEAQREPARKTKHRDDGEDGEPEVQRKERKEEPRQNKAETDAAKAKPAKKPGEKKDRKRDEEEQAREPEAEQEAEQRPAEEEASAEDETEEEAEKQRPRKAGDQAKEDGEEKQEESEPEEGSKHAPAAGPAVRRLARELGVEIARLEGRGAGGRVTAEEVKEAARGRTRAEGAEDQAPALPDFERFGRVERRRLSGIERAAAPHLARSWRTIPHVTQHDRADVTELERMRRRFEASRRPDHLKLAPTVLVVKAVVAALEAFPRFNASLDLEREELVLKRYYHIGVAVDTEYGLLVPVVRDADRKTTREIAREIAGLAERARERKLTRDELQGASFTVTNLGGIGGTSFTPVVSHPEVAILGVSRVREEPVVRDGQVVPRLLMPLSLSYDHRAVNGADAARFVRRLAELLEDPLRLLVES